MQSVLVIIIARLDIAAILPQSNLHAKSSIVAARDCCGNIATILDFACKLNCCNRLRLFSAAAI